MRPASRAICTWRRLIALDATVIAPSDRPMVTSSPRTSEWRFPWRVTRTMGPKARDPRRREVFRITQDGVAALVEWLGRDLTRDDVTARLKEIMLRFAFMDGNVPRTTAIRFLEQFEREFGAHAAELRARYERDSSSGIVHTGLLAFQFGVESMEAQLEWSRRARTRMAAKP